MQDEATGQFILDSKGQKIPLYMVLRKNIYGSPLASKNWANERNNFFLNKMPDIIVLKSGAKNQNFLPYKHRHIKNPNCG